MALNHGGLRCWMYARVARHGQVSHKPPAYAAVRSDHTENSVGLWMGSRKSTARTACEQHHRHQLPAHLAAADAMHGSACADAPHSHSSTR